MKTILLTNPKHLPKPCALRVARTVQPDVKLTYRKWVLHHRITNHKCL